MKIFKFDNFLNYVLNVLFTKQKIDSNPNIIYTDSLIDMLRQLHINYDEVTNELIELKPITDKGIYNAELERLIHKLNKLSFSSNYKNDKINYWLQHFAITKRVFFEWHDIIEDDNDLYLILDTCINWMELDPLVNNVLSKYDKPDLQEIHRTFEEFIKDHYVKELISFLENQKFSIQNEDTNPHPDIFKTAITFSQFKEYHKKHIVDPHLDYSYLFQRLLNEELIYKIEHKSFIEWLKENHFIKNNTYDILIIKNQFYSLNKSGSANRIYNFNNIFNINTT